MALTIAEKNHINKLLRKSPNEVYYKDFFVKYSKNRKKDEVIKDIILYFVDLWNENLNDDKFSEIKAEKYIYFIQQFFSIFISQYTKIPLELFVKLLPIKIEFNGFIEKNPDKDAKNINTIIEKLEDDINRIKKSMQESNYDLAQELQKEIDELEKLLKESQEKLDDFKKNESLASKNYNKLQKELEKKKKEIERLNEIINNLQKEFESSKKKLIDELNKKEEIDELNKKIETLTNQLQQLYKDYQELKEDNDKKDKKIKDVNSKLSKVQREKEDELQRKQKEEAILNEQEKRKELIKEKIITILLTSKKSHTEILEELKKAGLEIKSSELYSILNELKIKINRNCFNDITPVYDIDRRRKVNEVIDLTTTTDNFLFISNISFNKIDYKTIEKIYNYCINNNIHHIFNLGNIVTLDSDSTDLKKYKDLEKYIRELETNYPYDKTIRNFILGGANEIGYCNIGINPLEQIICVRNDFSEIGYERATININDNKNVFSVISPEIELYDQNSIETYLKKYNILQSKKDNIILLSNNSNSIDVTNRIISIPPINSDEFYCRIYHVQFIHKTDLINHVVVMPLIFEKEPLVASQIHYYR